MSVEIRGKLSMGQALAIAGVLVALGGGIVWAWRWAASYEPSQGGMTNQMMHRKSREMQVILDGVLARDFRRVQRAAASLEEISAAMGWFISEAAYGADGEAFRAGLVRLRTAAAAEDSAACSAAASEVVGACLSCHERVASARAAMVPGSEP